jgi:hypothetical protein
MFRRASLGFGRFAVYDQAESPIAQMHGLGELHGER